MASEFLQQIHMTILGVSIRCCVKPVVLISKRIMLFNIVEVS
jgi:hypothetical protein